MKIALVAPLYRPAVGGVETHVEQLAVRMAAAGHSVDVITQALDRRRASVEERDGVVVRRFPATVPSACYALAPGLWRFLRAEAQRYAIVHAHNYHALPALAAATSLQRALVFTPHYHGTSESAFRRLLHRPYRLCGTHILRRSNRIICVSDPEAVLLTRHFPLVRDRVVVIPNGVEAAAIDEAQPYPSDRTVILSAGRLENYKNVTRTIEAMPHLDERFVLRVIGDGPLRASLEKLVEHLGLANRVEILGRVPLDDLYRWFRTARVWVTMSLIEAMPITPLEVLAAGARVVASDIPAHRYIARLTGGTMTLVPPDIDPAGLASEITRTADLLRLPADVLSWDEVVAQTLSVYERALGRKSALVPAGAASW
jgi:glycosyltransferase involved in cell wall biosynthesis